MFDWNVLRLVLSIIASLLHSFGFFALWSVKQHNPYLATQRLYLIHLSVAENAHSIFLAHYYALKLVGEWKWRNYMMICVGGTFIWFLSILTMLTVDRFCTVYLHTRYLSFWTRRRTKMVLLVCFLISVTANVFFLLTLSNLDVTLVVFSTYLWFPLEVFFTLFLISIYAYIIRRVFYIHDSTIIPSKSASPQSALFTSTVAMSPVHLYQNRNTQARVDITTLSPTFSTRGKLTVLDKDGFSSEQFMVYRISTEQSTNPDNDVCQTQTLGCLLANSGEIPTSNRHQSVCISQSKTEIDGKNCNHETYVQNDSSKLFSTPITSPVIESVDLLSEETCQETCHETCQETCQVSSVAKSSIVFLQASLTSNEEVVQEDDSVTQITSQVTENCPTAPELSSITEPTKLDEIIETCSEVINSCIPTTIQPKIPIESPLQSNTSLTFSPRSPTTGTFSTEIYPRSEIPTPPIIKTTPTQSPAPRTKRQRRTTAIMNHKKTILVPLWLITTFVVFIAIPDVGYFICTVLLERPRPFILKVAAAFYPVGIISDALIYIFFIKNVRVLMIKKLRMLLKKRM